jgi:hypothetical protein
VCIFFYFFIYQPLNQAFSISILANPPKYLSTDQYCPLLPGSVLEGNKSEENRTRLDTVLDRLDLDKLHALNEQFTKINQKWAQIFSSSNAAHDTKKIGTQIRVSYQTTLPEPPTTEAIPEPPTTEAIPEPPTTEAIPEPPTTEAIPLDFRKSSSPILPCLGITSHELLSNLKMILRF